MTDLKNKTVFLFFKCSYLEGGIYPEYSFDSAYFNKDTATEMMKKDNSFLSMYNKIIPHKFSSETNILSWNSDYQCWMDKGAFMSVTLHDIQKSLYSDQPMNT